MTVDFPTLVVATRNQGKLKELRLRLSSVPVDILGLDDLPFDAPEVEETGTTFAANAILKATSYGWIAGAPTLADDSGLEVDALDGAPGVISARFSGEGADDASNNALLLEKLAETPDEARTARFRCSLALYIPAGPLAEQLAARVAEGVEVVPPTGTADHFSPATDGAIFLTDGTAEGHILREARGEGGFGYDPLFMSDELGQTFAEAFDAKKGVSHRARALETMLGWLNLGGR